MASAEHLSADVNFTGNLAAPPPIPKADLAPAHGGDSLLHGDRVVGTVTSAAWGHRVGKNLAMAFVDQVRSGDFRQGDEFGAPFECIHPDGDHRQNPVYMTSVACPLAAFARLGWLEED